MHGNQVDIHTIIYYASACLYNIDQLVLLAY